MNNKFNTEIEVELSTRKETILIPVEVEYEWDNNGIGAYEYWGAKCYDKGTDFVSVVGADWDKTDFTPEEVEEIESVIESKRDNWAEELENEAADAADDYPEPDYA